jgi:hypothetical protein
MFDTDNGYTGTINYALGLSDTTRADKSQSNGIESDNNSTGSSATPLTNPTYNHLTIIGLASAAKSQITNGLPSGTGKYGRAGHLRRNARFNITNSIFVGFNYGLSIDSQLGSASGTFSNVHAHGYTYAYSTEVNNTSFANAGTPAGGNFAYSAISGLALKDPFNRTAGPSSFGLTSASPTTTAGAFPSGSTTWADSWARF